MEDATTVLFGLPGFRVLDVRRIDERGTRWVLAVCVGQPSRVQAVPTVPPVWAIDPRSCRTLTVGDAYSIPRLRDRPCGGFVQIVHPTGARRRRGVAAPARELSLSERG